MTQRDSKSTRLKALGVLNPHPERVQAASFQTNPFFDPQDLVQVKYEMLRHVKVEGASKSEAAALFGVSRPTYYQAEAAYAREGLAGLLPRQRGPKGAHKLDAEIMAFLDTYQAEHGPTGARQLAQVLQLEFGLHVHPRSIERALARKKKTPDASQPVALPAGATETYESLRAQVVGGGRCRAGFAALRYHGMAQGLALIAVTSPAPEPMIEARVMPTMASEPALVRLLANMVLRIQSEVQHVY